MKFLGFECNMCHKMVPMSNRVIMKAGKVDGVFFNTWDICPECFNKLKEQAKPNEEVE